MNVDHAIRVLNECVDADHDAMLALVNCRVPVNDCVAKHDSVQVGLDDTLGVVGLINGLFGVDETGYGYITMECETAKPEPGKVPRITRIKGFRATHPGQTQEVA